MDLSLYICVFNILPFALVLLTAKLCFWLHKQKAVAFLCINITIGKGKIWCKILKLISYVFLLMCQQRTTNICQQSGEVYFQNSCGEKKCTKSVLKAVVFSAVTNFTADNTNLPADKQNMLV